MTRLSLIVIAALTLLMSAGGCVGENGGPDGEPSVSSDQGTDRVSQAVIIAKEIRSNPDAAQAILERHGMNAEQFEALMFEIAEDEEMSRAYSAAMGS